MIRCLFLPHIFSLKVEHIAFFKKRAHENVQFHALLEPSHFINQKVESVCPSLKTRQFFMTTSMNQRPWKGCYVTSKPGRQRCCSLHLAIPQLWLCLQMFPFRTKPPSHEEFQATCSGHK